MAEVWGIDLGGTKVEGVVLPAAATGPSDCLLRLRIESGAELGYEHVLGRIKTLVEALERETGRARPATIGLGIPGSCDPSTGLMRNCNSTALNGRPFPKDVEALLGVRVRVENDANCFALAETRWGSARGAASVFGVILGTGVGGGLVVHGRLLSGRQGIAGEWGHNPLESGSSALPCYCGRVGCVETVLSGPSLERTYAGMTGQKRPLAEIAARDREGSDLAATRTIDRLCEEFGRGIAAVINILDPAAIVIGGGVGNVARLYEDAPRHAARFVFHDRFSTPFLRPRLGDSAGVFGAAMLNEAEA